MGSVSEGDLGAVENQVAEGGRKEKPLGMRERIPAVGLKEYWYPALAEKRVGRKKPVEVKLLGERVVFFRDEKDEVVAVHYLCTHRGAFLSYGDTHFKGTLTCPYHGWTFNGKGDLLAVLGEGPTSTLPGSKGTKLRVYSTITIKGTVFVWMGEGPAVAPEEDLPFELFDPNIIVMTAEHVWNANWRPGIENFTDSHAYYVHRNSLEVLLQPTAGLLTFLHQGPNRPPFHVVNGRFLTFKPGEDSVLDYMDRTKDDKKAVTKREFQDSYPGLDGAKWPKTKARYYFSKVCSALRSLWKPTGPLSKNPEWTSGSHLPGTLHIDYHRWAYCRYQVPIDENRTNNFFFVCWRGDNAWQRFFWPLYFHLYFGWKMVQNFSAQDAVMAEITDYTAPERMSQSDLFPREWRRFVVEHGRDFHRQKEKNAKTGG
jgi:phenylpropionate dioxygenase-like ring-hydroxylating dioxygenase large terminal subunit